MSRTNDEDKLKQLQYAEKLSDEQDISDFLWLMGQKAGRRIVWKLLERAGVFQISMTGNSWTFFNEGRRSLGNMYLGELMELCPEHYATMVTEENERLSKLEEISDDD